MNVKYRNIYISLLGVGLMVATSAVSYASSALSQDFPTSDTKLPTGALVVLDKGRQSTVRPATSDQAMQLVGVVGDKPLVELGGGNKQVSVVTSGLTSVLISDINGPIHAGDKITASPVRGIGMKADTSTEVIGTAQSDPDTKTAIVQTITDKNGKQATIHISSLAVQVDVSYYAVSENKLSAVVPVFLLRTGNAIAGKDVSPLRILIGFSCLLVGFVTTGIILQAAVRSGIISVGRNPLAHKMLRQSLIDVMATTLGLLIVTSIVFYLILKV